MNKLKARLLLERSAPGANTVTSPSHRRKLLVWARVVFSQDLFTAFLQLNPFISLLPLICVQVILVG